MQNLARLPLTRAGKWFIIKNRKVPDKIYDENEVMIMALAMLAGMLNVLLAVGVVGSILMFIARGTFGRVMLFLMVALGVLLAVMAFASYPANYFNQRVVALLWGVLAVAGLFFMGRSLMFARLLVLASVALGLLTVFGFLW